MTEITLLKIQWCVNNTKLASNVTKLKEGTAQARKSSDATNAKLQEEQNSQ